MATEERDPKTGTDMNVAANTMGSVNMLAFRMPTPQPFTERVREQLTDSRNELRRMHDDMQAAFAEVAAAQSDAASALPALSRRVSPRPVHRRGVCRPFAGGRSVRYWPCEGTYRRANAPWELLQQRRHNVQACRDDLQALLDNTDRVLNGAVGLTSIIDQLAEEGLHPNQALLYEEELKSLSHKINDVFHQINLAAFHLHGTLEKEKEVAVNIAAQTETGSDVARHHQAVLWAYRQYLQYRATGNQYLTSVVQAIELFMEALRKEVMKRQVNDIHSQIQQVQKERAAKLAERERLREERRLAGEAFADEDDVEEELPELPPIEAAPERPAAPPQPLPLTPPAPKPVKEEAPVAPQEREDEEWDEDEMGDRPIFPLIILAVILLGVGYYYFFMKG